MARTGFISAERALAKVAVRFPTQKEAKSRLVDALVKGELATRASAAPTIAVPSGGALVDLGDPPMSDPGPEMDVDPSMWLSLLKDDPKRWDWINGNFHCSASDRAFSMVEVKFREKDVNALIKRHSTPEPEQKAPPQRRRNASWDDWVAALATLAHEHAIEPGMKVSDLLDQIDNRLQRWDLKLKARSTVGPTARAVLDRFGSNPPAVPKP